MTTLLAAHHAIVMLLVVATTRLADALLAYLAWVEPWAVQFQTNFRATVRRWKRTSGSVPATPVLRRGRRSAWNRTPSDIEAKVVALKAAYPDLGNGQLRFLLERLHGVSIVRETVRLILKRERPKCRTFQRIVVEGQKLLWGADLTRVMILGFIPVWILGVVDHHGSRLIALERVWWPTAGEVCRVFEGVLTEYGAPKKLLTDNGMQFRSMDFELLLARHDIEHALTKPRHPWTNGRIERLFRTFKETIFNGRWLILDVDQLDRFCRDFLVFYNRDRPHSAYGGKTPYEVHFKKPFHRARQRVTYFDGALEWWRFG